MKFSSLQVWQTGSDVIRMVQAITNTLNIQIYFSEGNNNIDKMFKSL